MKARVLLLIGFLLLLTGIRWWLGASLELSPDESYHYQWAQHPDVSYYSSGPGIAFAILGGTSMFGSTEFGVRFFAPLLGFFTSLVVYLLGRKLFRDKAAFWSVVGLNLLPLFNIDSVFLTVDSLSIFFWAAALYLFWLAIERTPGFSIFWPATGAVDWPGLSLQIRERARARINPLILVSGAEIPQRTEARQFLCSSPLLRAVPGATHPLESPARLAWV